MRSTLPSRSPTTTSIWAAATRKPRHDPRIRAAVARCRDTPGFDDAVHRCSNLPALRDALDRSADPLVGARARRTRLLEAHPWLGGGAQRRRAACATPSSPWSPRRTRCSPRSSATRSRSAMLRERVAAQSKRRLRGRVAARCCSSRRPAPASLRRWKRQHDRSHRRPRPARHRRPARRRRRARGPRAGVPRGRGRGR